MSSYEGKLTHVFGTGDNWKEERRIVVRRGTDKPVVDETFPVGSANDGRGGRISAKLAEYAQPFKSKRNSAIRWGLASGAIALFDVFKLIPAEQNPEHKALQVVLFLGLMILSGSKFASARTNNGIVNATENPKD